MNDVEISVSVTDFHNSDLILEYLEKASGIPRKNIVSYHLVRKSLDARSKPVFRLRYALSLKGETQGQREEAAFTPKDVNRATQHVIIVGLGPAGLFAALTLIQHGIKPIILERGKAVQDRRKDLAKLMKHGELNPESNYCFGEGGAGTFSDGKLYTRSKKRGPVKEVLDLLHHFGAKEDICYEAHPHIGSNHLPKVVQAMRNTIIECGGEVHFDTKLIDLHYDSKGLHSVSTNNGVMETKHCILATGHSARDIFQLFKRKKLLTIEKPFALGVRVEFPQELVNKIQYKKHSDSPALPSASISFVCQSKERGVYTFCMCPGGIICPAATEANGVVVNGWSPSKRNSYFANSGFVVEVRKEDIGSQSTLDFQKEIEEKCFEAGGGAFVAPAQRITDFIENKASSSLPQTSYTRGTSASKLDEVFPSHITQRLHYGLSQLVQKHPLLNTEEAVMLACESRTSSPIQIPRGEDGQHPELSGLYPCGEGAGYAGGILSAALDGIATAKKAFHRA